MTETRSSDLCGAVDLLDAAESLVDSGSTPECETGSVAKRPVELAIAHARGRLHAWEMRDGLRLRWLRGLLLRVLRPFAESQDEYDAHLLAATALLSDELSVLRSRVRDLESQLTDDEDESRD